MEGCASGKLTTVVQIAVLFQGHRSEIAVVAVMRLTSESPDCAGVVS